MTTRPALGWSIGLEGLRGVAVIAVMLFHFVSREYFPGGALGVDLFFVLSGFLITMLLLQEHAEAGRVSLRSFYIRRAFRLFPALAAMLVVYVAIEGDLGAVAAAVLYAFNFIKISGNEPPPAIAHLWSLSVEEQFYIVWPVALLALAKVRALLPVTIAAIAISALLPFTPGSYTRFYYSPDFRAQELLMGALVAQLYMKGTWREPPRVFIALAATFLAWCLIAMGDRVGFLFGGWYLAVALSCAVLVAAGVNARTPALTNRFLRYCGSRSYALYLWHLPIHVWANPLPDGPQFLIEVTLSFVAAELSWQLVERPVQAWRRRTVLRPAPA